MHRLRKIAVWLFYRRGYLTCADSRYLVKVVDEFAIVVPLLTLDFDIGHRSSDIEIFAHSCKSRHHELAGWPLGLQFMRKGPRGSVLAKFEQSLDSLYVFLFRFESLSGKIKLRGFFKWMQCALNDMLNFVRLPGISGGQVECRCKRNWYGSILWASVQGGQNLNNTHIS